MSTQFNESRHFLTHARRFATAITVAGGVLALAPAAWAVDRYVDAGAGSNAANACQTSAAPCRTIQHAVNVSASGDVIHLQGVTPFSVANVGINMNLTIRSDVGMSTLNAGGASRHFLQVGGATTYEGIYFANGDSGAADGGSVLVAGGSATFTGCEFWANHGQNGGAIACINACAGIATKDTLLSDNLAEMSGGAIYSESNTDVESSTFQDNAARLDGGAIYQYGATLDVFDTDFSRNLADQVNGGAISSAAANVTIRQSSLVGNEAPLGEGGGLYFFGNAADALAVTNTTFSANRAQYGGAIRSAGPVAVSVGHATLVDNRAAVGGQHLAASGMWSVNRSILHQTIAGAPMDECVGAAVLGVENRADSPTCNAGFFFSPASITGLGSLALRGNTQAYSLQAGSNAIGGVLFCALPVDQRGSARPALQCDVGAFERK